MADMAPPLAFPALHASHAGIWIATPDGETRRVGKAEAVARAAETPMILLNAPLVAQRLGYAELSGLDLLELFAFVHPARFVVPTAKGLVEILGISPLPFRGGAGGGACPFAERRSQRQPPPQPLP